MSEARSWRGRGAPTATPRVTAGRVTSLSQPVNDAVMAVYPVDGKILQCTARIDTRTMANQKLGTARPSVEKDRAPVSRLPPGRTPDRMPRGMPTTRDTMAEATTRPKVTGNRVAICWLTDCPVESEVPRFP